MSPLIQLRFLILAVGIFFTPHLFSAAGATAAKKDPQTLKGDKAYAKLKFARAIRLYTQALDKGGNDTLYLEQRIAASYHALNDQVNAEKAYASLVNNPKAGATDKYHYAELLRVDKSYASARKYYEEYAKANADNKSVNTAVEQMDRIPALSVDNTAYKIYPVNFNTPKSDYAPVFYKDSLLIFSSNRACKKDLYDKWSMTRYSNLYVSSLDSSSKPEKIKIHLPRKSFESGAAFNAGSSQLIFSTGNFRKKFITLKNGMKLPVMNLYSAAMSDKSATNLMALSVNGDFSNAHPSLSKDGKTLYFASDRLGGHGGTDIYMSTANASGVWSDAQNLGDAVNTPFDEKFPFIADDGTLYFASNSPNGLGGLDIYKTSFVNGQWTKPQNLGAPINSSYDDFSFIYNNAKRSGFFSSNRPGGKGEDDIYKFTYDDVQLDYNVKIRVLDAITLKPIVAASLSLDCQTATAANTLSDANGEKEFTITGGKNCSVEAWSPGYKNGSVDVSPINSNGMLMISLERDSSQPVSATTPAQTSNQTLAAKKPVRILDNGVGMYVPVTSNCAAVTVVDVKNGFSNSIQPDANGEVHFDLQLNRKYAITHGETTDTIITKGLRPGQQIIAGCTYTIGQVSVVQNIYYNVNRWNIRKDAANELDKLATIMKNNPGLQVELSSNTDCRASSRYNMILSARRAKSAVDYLVKKGVKMNRILAVGYGESKLTNDCVCEPGNYSPCDEAQHQANRRTEVKVLKY